MTIIAVANNIMVADGASEAGNLRYPLAPGRRKINRAPDGSLTGGAGFRQHTQALAEWTLAGMDFGNLPKLAYLDEEENRHQFMNWLWLKPNGTLWFSAHGFHPYEIAQPYAIGIAAVFWEGAYHACLSPTKALQLALKHCTGLSGEPQVEHLHPCPM